MAEKKISKLFMAKSDFHEIGASQMRASPFLLQGHIADCSELSWINRIPYVYEWLWFKAKLFYIYSY